MQVIDYLVTQLRDSARYNSQVQVPPAVVLWTDETRQWQAAMPIIKRYLPELLELGEYLPAERTGPAIWLKCMIAGTAPEQSLPADAIPILYLPGVSRKDLRAIDQCSLALQPLAELQYRGCWWAYNTAGRDWSVGSFLSNPKVGLQLDVAKDGKTQQALLEVLPDLLEAQAASLQGKRLETSDLYALAGGDPIRNMLAWLNEPEAIQKEWQQSNRWQHFCGQSQDAFGVDPANAEISSLLPLLCDAQGPWQAVWERFSDTAAHHSSLIKALYQVQPSELLSEPARYPFCNEHEEQRLAQTLTTLVNEEVATIRTHLASLNVEHAARREWLWAGLGLSPWAMLLDPLSQLSELTRQPLGGPDIETMASYYQEKVWQTDDLALQVMALASDSAMEQVAAALLGKLYTPWLEAVTLHFQHLVKSQGYPGGQGVQEPVGAYQGASTVLFFVDGLRLDMGHRLMHLLAQANLHASLKTRWSALPSLTATAKAAVTPLSPLLTGDLESDKFVPQFADSGADFSSHHFKKGLAQAGWQYLEGHDCGEPEQGKAWVQCGDLDNLGHERQQSLPRFIDHALKGVVERIVSLLDAGWTRVHVVTDHGWLWSPEKLPKAELTKHMTELRTPRCAIVKGNGQSDYLQCPWHWNPAVRVVMAPGISLFQAGDYYNHGGVSLQECLTPELMVSNNNK